MPFERVDVGLPKLAELSQPCVDLLQRLRPKPIEPMLGLDAGFDEACLPENPQVLRNRGLRQTELPLDIPHGLLR